MKGLMCYYSSTGNTKLACGYINKRLKNIKFDMFDIVKDGVPDIEKYDIVGFAAWADYLGMPKKMSILLEQLNGEGKGAFVFNTFGNFNGNTLKMMEKGVKKRGFKLIAGHALHTPENVAPLILIGMTREDSPSPKEMAGFNEFISKFDEKIKEYEKNKKEAKPLISYGAEILAPALPRKTSQIIMGQIYVDEKLCTKCGLCETLCPYGAIKMEGLPQFDKSRCYGCWACYNRCPAKAIYTKKFKGKGHYPKPHEKLAAKLK